MFDKKRIRDFNNSPVSYEEFIEIAKKFDSEGYETFVGTDSQHCKMHVSIVTSICFHRKKWRRLKNLYIKEKKNQTVCTQLLDQEC